MKHILGNGHFKPMLLGLPQQSRVMESNSGRSEYEVIFLCLMEMLILKI
jgi:hypothetical protein